MTPADIIALGQALYGEHFIPPMAADLEYSTSQLGRVVYDGAPVTQRMSRRLVKLGKRRKTAKADSVNLWKDRVTKEGND
jgi:hypothetical protein